MALRISVMLAVVVIAQCVNAQQAAPSKPSKNLSHQLQVAIQELDVPGISAAVAREQRIIARGSAGVRRVERETPIESSDRFHIGSCAKPMAATVIALLVRDGVLRWDMTLAQALPAQAGAMHESYRDRTILQLVQDRAGVPAFDRGGSPEFGLIKGLEGSPGAQREQLTRRILSSQPDADEFLFSNASIPIAMAIAESWTQQSWETMMRQRLFKPLHMTSAGFGWPASAQRRDQPRGHVPAGDAHRPLPLNAPPMLPPALAPAGDVHCSASDLAIFGTYHLAGLRGEPIDNSVLDEADFRLLHDPGDGFYAAGWLSSERDGRRLSVALGASGAFFAILIVDPAHNAAVAVCANSGDSQEACETIARRLLDEFAPIE